MNYYKIILQNKVVGVGTLTLTWGENIHQLVVCTFDEAQYVQDVFTEKLYHPTWMRTPPLEAPQVDIATVIIIGASEYDELYEQLKDNEQIPYVPTPPPEPEPEPEPEPTPIETPMTIQQMREKIIEQGEMIDMLTECLLEVSEIIYDE